MANVGSFSEEEDLKWATLALEQARRASSLGESPFGAVIAIPGKLLAAECNQTISKSDPTYHAETAAIRTAILIHGSEILRDATLYSSCAPCIMCLGTAFYSGINRIVYSLRISDVAKRGSGDPFCEPSELISYAKLNVHYIDDFLRGDALKIIKAHLNVAGKL